MHKPVPKRFKEESAVWGMAKTRGHGAWRPPRRSHAGQLPRRCWAPCRAEGARCVRRSYCFVAPFHCAMMSVTSDDGTVLCNSKPRRKRPQHMRTKVEKGGAVHGRKWHVA